MGADYADWAAFDVFAHSVDRSDCKGAVERIKGVLPKSARNCGGDIVLGYRIVCRTYCASPKASRRVEIL